MSWRDLAACQGMDTEIFFTIETIGGPRKGRGSLGEKERMEAAKKICLPCEVREQCLDYAIDTGVEFGVFGGMTPKERGKYPGKRQAA